ncbi:MAG: hypothetical protein ABR525_08365 [Candidatus Limnocylindria bacterium]
MVRRASYVTKIGSTVDASSSSTDVVLTREPEVGSTLRTKGRFYFLCEVSPPDPAAGRTAREVAELARDEYYYDLSAGVEMSLRRALRHANRRAAQRLRETRGRSLLHCACAVIVGSELYGVRVGAAQLFVVRRARLFLPGEEPGELADFVHRTTTRQAESLGSDVDVLPGVWRQSLEPGDTLILASGALIEALGAEALKNAAVTLHPRSAAQHVHDRFTAEGLETSDAALFVEIGLAPDAAVPSARGVAAVRESSPESAGAGLPSPITGDALPRRPRAVPVLAAIAPVGPGTTKAGSMDLELAKRATTLPRLPHTARERMQRRQSVTTALAVVLLIVASAVGVVAYRDFTASRATSDFQVALQAAHDELLSAQRIADRKPVDADAVRQRLLSASARLDDAARSPSADAAAVADLRAQVTSLDDRVSSVLIDLGRVAAGAAPRQLTGTANGVYAADPGSGRLWRVFGDPAAAAAVLEKGKGSVGSLVTVSAQDDALFAIDDARKVWKAEGNTVADVTPAGSDRWREVTSTATFVGNLYVLDAQSGQLWRSEATDSGFGPVAPFLASALQANTARSVAVDGAIWIVTSGAEILKFQRSPQGTAVRVDFAPRWQSDPVRPSAIQAIDGQTYIYLLDGPGKRLVQMARDGREIARFDLPPSLQTASAFFVSEAKHVAYSVHGSKIAVTDINR